MRRLLITILTVAALSGCDRSFALFPLTVESGGEATTIVLTERPGRPPDEEGYLPDDGTALRLTLSHPYPIPAATALLVEYAPASALMTVVVRTAEGEEIARKSVGEGMPTGDSNLPVAAAVPLPSGAEIDSISITADEELPSRTRVLGLALAPERAGVGTSRPWAASPGAEPRALYVSSGALVTDWNADSGSGRWEIDRRSAAGWEAHDPVEIRYRYERAETAPPELPETIAVPSATVIATEADGRQTRLRLDVRPGPHRVIVYPLAERISPVRYAVDGNPGGLEIEWIGPVPLPGEIPEPIPIDMGSLLRYPPEVWRRPDFELFSWSLYPEVLVFDTVSYEVQSSFFRRLAFFVEKAGYRGRLLTDRELGNRHGYNAHNYRPEGLAAFFQAARDAGFPLNPREELLLDIVLAHGIIRSTEDGFLPGNGGILSVSQESGITPVLRELLLSHESYHGVYYMEPEYVRTMDEQWESLDLDQQRYWRLLLGGLGYDVRDEYLVRNEYHAYLLQQPLAEASWYFEHRSAERIARWYPDSASWLEGYLAEYGGTHREQAARAQATLYSLTGLVARDVFCLERIEP
ncbi:MAG: hypothetical protein ACOCXN_09185 [Spirochaetota bacterium]